MLMRDTYMTSMLRVMSVATKNYDEDDDDETTRRPQKVFEDGDVRNGSGMQVERRGGYSLLGQAVLAAAATASLSPSVRQGHSHPIAQYSIDERHGKA